MPCYRWDGSKWRMSNRSLFRRWNGSAWVDTHPKRFDGSSWVDAEKEKLPFELTLSGSTANGLIARVVILFLKPGLQYPTSPLNYYVKLYATGSLSKNFPSPRVYNLSFFQTGSNVMSNTITLGFDYEYQTCYFWLETRDGIFSPSYITTIEAIDSSFTSRSTTFFSYRSS